MRELAVFIELLHDSHRLINGTSEALEVDILSVKLTLNTLPEQDKIIQVALLRVVHAVGTMKGVPVLNGLPGVEKRL